MHLAVLNMFSSSIIDILIWIESELWCPRLLSVSPICEDGPDRLLQTWRRTSGILTSRTVQQIRRVERVSILHPGRCPGTRRVERVSILHPGMCPGTRRVERVSILHLGTHPGYESALFPGLDDYNGLVKTHKWCSKETTWQETI